MRVLQVLEPGVDGVFRHVEGLVGYLAANGHEVGLAFSSRRGSPALDRLVRRVSDAGHPVLDLRVANAPQPGDVAALVRLARLIGRWRPDVVHAHSSKAGALARLLGPFFRCPVIYTPHAYFGMGRAGLKASVFTAIERCLGGVGRTVHVSEDEAEFGRSRLGLEPGRAVVVTNGIDVGRFRPPMDGAEKAACRRSLGLPEAPVLIGTLGRLSYQKDPETTYRAVAGLLRAGAVELVHVGAGELEGRCGALAGELGISGCVHRIGYLDDPAAFYRCLDLFVLTSRYEGLSLAVLEALATNLPVVLSRAAGNAVWEGEGLSHAGFGAVGDVEGLGAAARGLLGLGGEPNHRRLVEERYSDRVAYGRLEGLYREATGADGGKS